jgi:hypothetical protein
MAVIQETWWLAEVGDVNLAWPLHVSKGNQVEEHAGSRVIRQWVFDEDD